MIIRKLFISTLILFLILFIFLRSNFNPSKDFVFTKYKFIAHAAGGINDTKYSNSKEALINSIKLGYKLIELDLLETKDGFIVAAHDWKSFKRNCVNFNHQINQIPLTYKEFNDCKYEINSIKFTQLNEDEINDIFNTYLNLFLVTDKINNYNLLSKKFNFKDRIIPETFSIKDFINAKYYGFENALYPFKKYNLFFEKLFNIKILTISYEDFIKNKKKVTDLYEKGLKIYLYTSNDQYFIKEYLDKSITGVYTDFWNLSLNKCISLSKCESY